MRAPDVVLGLLAVSSTLVAQQATAPTFAPPVRVQADGKDVGTSRLYPSPVLHDTNGDGLADLVIGDLRGRITVALRLPGAGLPRFAKETKLLAKDGEELDFANW